jgi:hypothetical protein
LGISTLKTELEKSCPSPFRRFPRLGTQMEAAMIVSDVSSGGPAFMPSRGCSEGSARDKARRRLFGDAEQTEEALAPLALFANPFSHTLRRIYLGRSLGRARMDLAAMREQEKGRSRINGDVMS